MDPFEPSVVIRNVEVVSDDTNYWANGVDITSAWNVCMTDCFISGGRHGDVWNSLSGNGIALHRSCVNSHFLNCHCNYWSNGFYYDTGTGTNDPNTQGIFFSNCSMVAVKKGCFITGNPNYSYGIAALTWMGGLIEIRSKNVTSGSAAFHLVRVDQVMISGMMMTNEDLTTTSYGVFADTCNSSSIIGCSIYSFTFGPVTVGTCKAIVIGGCNFVNCGNQVNFSPNTTASRSYGHVLFNNSANEVDQNGTNKIGWV